VDAIRAENLVIDFGGVRALDGVSFGARPGARLGIIGPNGAGKTTLFQSLSGMLQVTSGTISYFGKDVTRLPAFRRARMGLGRTFQITSLFQNLTVADNVLLALEALSPMRYNLFRPLSSYRSLIARADQLLEKWKLLPRRNELVRNLSYGEQRLLQIVLTFAQGRSVLLLDEPTCGLSPEEAVGFVSILKELPTDITILLIDHDLDVLFGLAEEVMVLHFGRVLARGSPAEVKANPRVQEIYTGQTHASA
jgi:branched-chain amino acid transport system ATP-binding protein